MMFGSADRLYRGFIIIKARLLSYTCVLLMVAPVTHAAMDATVQMQGRVLKPTCSLNNGNTLDVDFGPVNIESPQSKPIALNMSCQGGSDKPINFVIRALPSTASTTATTNMPGLDIRFSVNSTLNTNTSYSLTPNVLKALRATPVIQPGYDLKGGSFKVTVTLSAEYN